MTSLHSDEVQTYLDHWSKTPPSPLAISVAKLLDDWQGLHHFDESIMKKVDWSNNFYIKLKHAQRLATFDFNDLTRLVFFAHDRLLRVEIAPLNFRFLQLLFHQRPSREGSISHSHPTIEQALADHRRTWISV